MVKSDSAFSRFVFKYRSYTPLPIIFFAFVFCKPGGLSLWIGLSLIILGEAVRIWALGYIGPVSRTIVPVSERLVTSGPYSFVRNPLYIGNWLLSVGAAIFSGAFFPWFGLGVGLFFIIQYAIIIPLEESGLAVGTGKDYCEYKNCVPALFLRLTPYRDCKKATFELGPAINGEMPTLHTLFALIWLLILVAWIKKDILSINW